ncbi:Transmembrane 9 superfamily member 4 [Exophiala dermatitidis]
MAPDFRLSVPWLSQVVVLFACVSHAFYIPGYSIRSYQDGENIPLLVNKVYSSTSQLQYAYFNLPFVCPPTGRKPHGSSSASGHSVPLNLGEVLRGDRIKTSDLEVNMGQDDECQYLCDRAIGATEMKWAQQLIEQEYLVEWILDNLPGATSFVTVDRSKKYYAAGFKLGYKDFDVTTGKERYYLYNHHTLVVRWRKAPGKAGENGGKVVVGFEVYPKSISGGHRNDTGCPFDVSGEHEPFALYIPSNNTRLQEQYPDSSYVPADTEEAIDKDATITIPYTYSVYFREANDIDWANRWDLYFNDQEESTSTHWLAIVNSLIISGILGAVCVVIWGRTTQGDVKGRGDGVLEEARLRITKRIEKKLGSGLLEKVSETGPEEEALSDEEPLEEISGWKLLHGDVFRPPPYGGLLAPLIGSGMQLVFMIVGLLALSCVGVLNPSWRGGFWSVGVGLFVLAGGFSGYFSARVYKTFGGQDWRKNAMMTALLFPGLVFSLVFVLNLFTWAQASSTALPFSTLVGLVCLWLLIQLPLVHLGAYFGFFRSPAWEHPTRTNAIPRQIPPQVWYTKHQITLALGAGLLSFAVLFIELIFLFKSLYLDKSSYYYVFGFLSIISALLTITIAETVIITTYIQLCAENYHWWWQSFLVGGASGFWIFVYSVWYYATRLHVEGFVSSLLLFSYSALACAVYSLATGTIGFLTAYMFIRRIYSGVKVD